jgi:RHS repeat-associated protein
MQMPGRKYSAGSSSYRYGFNGKENDNEVKGEGNQQDYGMRIYDPRLGRFLSVDPLIDEYPELTPYQFASNRPIDGIDLDGEEYTPAELNDILSKAKAALGTMISENTIVLRGASNAIVNANFLGTTDKLGTWGTDNLEEYSTNYEQSLYLWGRVVGDVAAALQGLAEISGGSAAVTGGLAVSGTGAGAVAGLPTAIVGGLVAGHGAGAGATAGVDLGQTINQLRQLGAFGTSSSDAAQKKETPEQKTNQQANSASNKKFNGQNDTKGNSQKESFNKAKDQNGIPRSQQPDKTTKIKEMSKGKPTGKTLREYQFTNSKGGKVSIRRDNPTRYNQGGKGDQGKHHNAGKTGGKLNQHHDY